MVNSKKIIEMAKKWQKVASLGKSASSSQTGAQLHSDACSTSVAEKGHFIVYTSDSKRFMVPLRFLGSVIFVELLKMSEDELGLPRYGPILLPCDSVFMDDDGSLCVSFLHEKLDLAHFLLCSDDGSLCVSFLHEKLDSLPNELPNDCYSTTELYNLLVDVDCSLVVSTVYSLELPLLLLDTQLQ
ncbi:auxin-responsive protein SAUR68-like [Asparagus officinalis]|uniref:auxin-responsive protein SAUR68-like n=1 Tax=Asparagus officinalis TaxID=4686 RepID=UPI00098E5B42|nr:auxin-responsive protein SAUR68-like [Asparagus officinalis]